LFESNVRGLRYSMGNSYRDLDMGWETEYEMEERKASRNYSI
jgi:hypothetical protein